ncbi:hypothetical protein A4V11_04305 [Pediococcus acidilactici]|uniref:hypothetical protein n=1 Tax=Pediococcus acidilactici TaxID=1254 RepID=UPI000568473D|nr:hypothetical protein [Pediococcus acidilactici]AOW74279.1 hypothetical protein A4V11_04305 [Pediococcus acidilactici]
MIKDVLFGILALILIPIIFIMPFYLCYKDWVPVEKNLAEWNECPYDMTYWEVWRKNIANIYWKESLGENL